MSEVIDLPNSHSQKIVGLKFDSHCVGVVGGAILSHYDALNQASTHQPL